MERLEQRDKSETATWPMESETESQSIDPQPVDSETGARSIDPQPEDSETGARSIDPQPVDSETGARSIDPQPVDSETGARSIDPQPMLELLSTTREVDLESAPELTCPTKMVSDLSDVSIESNDREEGALDSSMDVEEVKVCNIVPRKLFIPPKKDRLEPLKMDMSKSVVMPLTSSQLSLECLECHIIFSDHKSRERHLKLSHPAQYEQCILGDALFACYVCDRHFTNSTDLMTHQRAHTEKQPFKCPICGDAFSRSSELTLHKKVHIGQHGYTCSVCGKPCKTLTLLKYHSRTHTGERPYVCKECGKRFSMPKALQKHQQTHSVKGSEGNEEIQTSSAKALQKKNGLSAVKYPCSTCKATFKSDKTRMHHMKRKHPTEPLAGQQVKLGMPIITPAPIFFPHLEPLGPLQQVDNIDTEQIRKLIESLGNVQRVNQVVVLGQVPPHAQPLDLQRFQCIGEPFQLHLSPPQLELVELKETGSLELGLTVMPCEGTETMNTIQPVVLDEQMEHPSLSLTQADEYAVPVENAGPTIVEAEEVLTHRGEMRPEQLLEPSETGQTAEGHSVDRNVSKSEGVELEQVQEQTVVLELTPLVPTLDMEPPPTVQEGLMSESPLVPITELEQTSGQSLIGQCEIMPVPTLTPTVELELTTSSLVQTVTFTQTSEHESNQGQGETSHTEADSGVKVISTLQTDSAKQKVDEVVQDSTEKHLLEGGEREKGLGMPDDAGEQGFHPEVNSVKLNVLQTSLPPPETKLLKTVSQLPINMSVQEFVKVRKRKQATLQLSLEAMQNFEKPVKRQKTKKGRLVVKFGPKEKKEKKRKSKKPKPSRPVKLIQREEQTQHQNEMFVSTPTNEGKKVPSKQKAVKEKNDKQRKMGSKYEIQCTNTVNNLQVQQMQVTSKKKKMKRNKDAIHEGSEQSTEQDTIITPKPPNKNTQTHPQEGQLKKTKDGKQPRKEKKRKLEEADLEKTSLLSLDIPDPKLAQQSLLLLKGHKQPQLKVYKLDATQASDEPPEPQSQSSPSKGNTLRQRRNGPGGKPLNMLSVGMQKKVGRPKKNQKGLSLLTSLFTTVSSDSQPTKPKRAPRKRSGTSKVETEGVISSSHSGRALECNDCGANFNEVSSLQGHKAAMHAVESPELTYTNGNIFEGVTGPNLGKAPNVSTKSVEIPVHPNPFGMHVASDWDMEAEVGETASSDKEGRGLSFPALNPSPSLALAPPEGDGCEDRSLQGHGDPPEHSTPSHSPPPIVSPAPLISDQAKPLLSGQFPPHLTSIETLDTSLHAESGGHVAGEDVPESQSHVQESRKISLTPDYTSEHQAPVEDDIKEELLLEVDLVTVGEQNEREGQSLSQKSAKGQTVKRLSQSEVENTLEPLAHEDLNENVKTAETRPSTQSSSSSTEHPEIKQEEEEILVQRKEEEKKGVAPKNVARRRRRGSGRGRRTPRGRLDGDSQRRVRSDKDTDECQVVYEQPSLPVDSEMKDEVQIGAPQPCRVAASSVEPEIDSRPDPHREIVPAASAPSVPSVLEESPEEQVVFELESVTTSVEEVLKSEEGLGIGVEEQDRNTVQSPGIILERFLTSRRREGEDEDQRSDSPSILHNFRTKPHSEPQHQQGIKSVLVKQEMTVSQNDPLDAVGQKQIRWSVEQVDIHNGPGLQPDMGERIKASSVDSSVRQCIFYPVKQEEREVLLEPSQSHAGVSSSVEQGDQFVEHQAMPTFGRLYDRSSAEEHEGSRAIGEGVDTAEGELDFEQQDTSELLEFLLNSSDEEDSVDMELSDPQPDSEALLMAGFQNHHGQHHPNETTTINMSTCEPQAHSRPTTGSSYAQRDGDRYSCGKPIDYFLRYLGWDTWADIANCTNKMSKLTNPVTAKEVCQFVGIHIAMGTLKFPSLKLYWQDFTKVPLIAEAMSASRFSQISCKLKLASPPIDNVRDVRHDRGASRAGNNSNTDMPRDTGCDEDRAQDTPTHLIAGPVKTGSDMSGQSHTSQSQMHDQSAKFTTCRNSITSRNVQRCADQQNCSAMKMDPLWRVRPILNRIQAGCEMLRREGDHGIDQYTIPLTARAVNHNDNQPSLNSTVLLGSSGMILHLDLSLDLSDKEGTVEKMVPRDGMVYLCKQELSTPAMLERLLESGVHSAGKVGGARGQIGDEFVSSDGKLMLRRSHHGFILSTVGKGQPYMASLVDNFEKAEKAARLNRDLRELYRTPQSASAASCWPQVILWYLTDVALVNSWLHYRQDRRPGPEPLNLMAFRLEVSKALILSSGSDTQDSIPPQPPAQTVHTQGVLPNPGLMQVGPLPDAATRYDGSGHWPEQVGEGEESRCRFGGCERTSRVRCLKCCVFLCISRNHNCFLNFHSHGFF
ncbi:uncharacterized protein [Osmerus mordax]|uniref:uncharacterized protein isoform X2 n=1 Tax=Osmerus mordax TaxID=8014 RepID=UPI00350FBF8B